MNLKFIHSRTLYFLIIILLVFYFLPNILYILVNSGFVKLADTKKTLGISLIVSDSWYPISSDNSVTGKFLFRNEKVTEVTYVKNNWLLPWESEFIIISKLSNKGNELVCKAGEQYAFKSFTPDNEPTSSGMAINNTYVYFVPKLNLSFTSNNINSFREINKIVCESTS